MTDATSIANRYIALWNEINADRRGALLADLWTEDGTYIDPLMQGRGRSQIDALISAVHERFPGFHFALVGQADGYGDRVRFSWQLGPEGADGPIKGTDFATLDNGRLKEVVGFLDQVPAGA
ncbi:nuclear transport factor 2 family protein [Microvirga lotononidis]|uniref:SnoaL-like polyketide cyclase n=1 Tax=Microvirga lotononidis TaxID=864069 RepID=I4Z111_9HYPH|nr:nuclear transport factor 2 family protein [Microvirga lotononidis]EIM29903.1 SnoaL-like polyketide cyclase [Microvirga lotononidis]WQO31020.1 nuclear transport factor 2 family protein [Microvirga lotononidis]